MSTQQEELEVLYPQNKSISIKGVDLTIQPFKFGQLQSVFKTIEPVAQIFAQLVDREQNNQIQVITSIITNGGDNIRDFLVIGTKQSKEWVDDLEVDEAIEVLTALVEVNTGFFIQKILPKLTQTLEKVNGQIS